MDYLYADLNEIVDPFAYEVKKTDGTIQMQIDNDKRTLSANVVYAPGSLVIRNGKGQTVSFNGGSNKTVSIPEYKIKEVSPTDGDVRRQYQLFKWDFDKEQYVQVEGDTIYLEEQLDEINIENGSLSEDSQKQGIGTSGISSVKYKHNGYDVFVDGMLPPDSEYKNTSHIDKLIGMRTNDTLHGGTQTGVQSMAFGGQAYGLGNQYSVSIVINGQTKIFNVDNNKPLVLKDLISGFTYIEQNGEIKITINGDTENYFYVLRDDNGNFSGLAYRQNRLRNQSVVIGDIQVVKTQDLFDTPTAIGNQSISFGGSTHADFDFSQAFGLGTITSRKGQMVVGTFNSPEEDAIFIVGNGWYDYSTGIIHRSNAMAVMRDGTIKTYDKNNNG